MKYAVNDEGIQALRALSHSIQESSCAIQNAVNVLKSVADENAAAIGPHRSSIAHILEEVQQAEAAAAEPVQTVSDKLYETAERYQKIMDDDPFSRLDFSGIEGGDTADPVSSSPLGGSAEGVAANRNDTKGNWGFEYIPLLQTQQTTEKVFLCGREVTLFDHPLEGNSTAICNQGSAYPTGPQQTCGCCACGTLINKAGGFSTEHSVVAYAWDHGLCRDDGRTAPQDWIGILNSAGITSHDCTGGSLESLADQVEQGHGVVIGVSACTYCPELYGRYSPLVADGHALVLESVIRDAKTGEIIEYVVTDSNGISAKDSCKRVPKAQMEKAFRRHGSKAIATDEIIW